MKNSKALNKVQNLQDKINKLDRDTLYLVHYDYRKSWHNIYHSFLLMLGKTSAAIKNQADIDHSAYLSRFIKDGDNWGVFTSEMNYFNGLEENYFIDRAKKADAKIYLEAICKMNKIEEDKFRKSLEGIDYDKWVAGNAGQDWKFLDKIFKKLSKVFPKVRLFNKKAKGLYCTWHIAKLILIHDRKLVAKLVKSALGVDIKGMSDEEIDRLLRELTPPDLFEANLGKKEIL